MRFCLIKIKKLILLVLGISLFSCSNKKENNVSYQKHNLEFLNWNINIPENYVRATFEDYKKTIFETSSDSIYLLSKISQIENIQINAESYALFYDNKNIENMFFINFMLNQQPNEILKNQIANELHSNQRRKGKENGFKYKPLENRLINNWLIKIKGEKINNKNTTYITFYFSSNFGAYVLHLEKELDFEKELTE
jgi:hypothetical protein